MINTLGMERDFWRAVALEEEHEARQERGLLRSREPGCLDLAGGEGDRQEQVRRDPGLHPGSDAKPES